MKSCSRCGYWKSDREFYPDRRPHRSRDGLHHACKDCERESARERAKARYWARKLRVPNLGTSVPNLGAAA